MTEKEALAMAVSDPQSLPVPLYEPPAREADVIAAQTNRIRQAAPSPSLRVVQKNDGPTAIEMDHPDAATATALLMSAIGTTDYDFLSGFLAQLGSTARVGGEVDADKLNFLLSVVKNTAPQDHIEAMLAAQMGAIHIATLDYARRLAGATTSNALEAAERGLNKLARTFAAQTEALKRYRSGGEQKVLVQHQHVNVHDGGQAIVGGVQSMGGGSEKKVEATS